MNRLVLLLGSVQVFLNLPSVLHVEWTIWVWSNICSGEDTQFLWHIKEQGTFQHEGSMDIEMLNPLTND